MKYADLREFLAQLEARGELKRIAVPISPRLEITESGNGISTTASRGGTSGAFGASWRLHPPDATANSAKTNTVNWRTSLDCIDTMPEDLLKQ